VLPQRRLADEHQLQGVLPGRRQGRQPQHLLEGLAAQVLRLINDERHIAALAALLAEALLYLDPQDLGRVGRPLHLETPGHYGEDLQEGEGRLPQYYCGELRRRDAG
jgi:hypothetical protein